MKSLGEQRKEILELLQKLESFPKTSTVRQLQRELREKLSKIESRIREREKRRAGKKEDTEESKERRRHEANLKRSKKMKQKHHYIRLIHSQHPENSYRDIWKWYSQRKRGKKVPIPDVIWRNPSP